MNRDDIIRLAQEAGIHYSFGMELERFAALVAEAERAACVEACLTIGQAYEEDGLFLLADGASAGALAISARSKA